MGLYWGGVHFLHTKKVPLILRNPHFGITDKKMEGEIETVLFIGFMGMITYVMVLDSL